MSTAYYLNPNNGEVSALYSRVCFFIGYYLEEDPAKSDSLFIEGMETSWDFIVSTEAYQEGYALTEGDPIVKMISGI